MRFVTRCFGFWLILCQFACQERYGYLSKVDAPLRRGTIEISVVNRSPELLSDAFQNEMERHCIRRLQKEGYRYTQQNPMYELKLEMRVDSSLNFGIAYAMPRSYYYSRRSTGLQLHLEIKHVKTGRWLWEDFYDLYFFGNESRDLNRAKGVVRYMISGMSKP